MEHFSKRINEHPHKKLLINTARMVIKYYQMYDLSSSAPKVIDFVNKTKEQNIISLRTAFFEFESKDDVNESVMFSAIVSLNNKLREDYNSGIENKVDPLLAREIIMLALKITHRVDEEIIITSTAMHILFSYPSLADYEIIRLMISKLTYHLSKPRVMFITLAALISINNRLAIEEAMDILPNMDSYGEFIKSELSTGLVLLMRAMGRKVSKYDLQEIRFRGYLPISTLEEFNVPIEKNMVL